MSLTEEQRNFLLGKAMANQRRRNVTGAGSFSPSSISDLGLWLEAQPENITEVTGVSDWDGLDSNDRDATQGTGSAQPTFNNEAAEADRNVQFDGTNDFLSITPTPFLSDTAGEFAIIFQRTSGTRIPLTFCNTTDGNELFLYISGAGEFKIRHDGNDVYDTTKTGDVAVNSWALAFFGSNGTSYYLEVNGVVYTINNGTDDGNWIGDLTTTPSNMSLGSRQISSPTYWAEKIKAVAYVGGRLFTSDERDNMRTYFNNKYSVY